MEVLLVILTLLLLLLLTPVGVHVAYGQELLVRLRIGLLRLTVYPPKRPKKEKPEKEKPKKEDKPAKPKQKPSLEQILYSIEKLLPLLGKVLNKVRRRIRIDPLRANVVFGGEDPADTASLYGKVEALATVLIPAMEKALTVKNREIYLSTDYQAERTAATVEVGVRILIWDVFGIAFTLLGGAVPWLIGFIKRRKPPEKGTTTEDKTAGPADAAANA